MILGEASATANSIPLIQLFTRMSTDEPRISLFRHEKARNKIIRDPSVIIRVIDNLSVKDTTADYHDHLLDQHLLPSTSCTAVLAAHDVYASLWRAESLAIDVVDKGGGLFLLISSLLYTCGAARHSHAERLGEHSLPVVHGDCHGDYAAVRFTIV